MGWHCLSSKKIMNYEQQEMLPEVREFISNCETPQMLAEAIDARQRKYDLYRKKYNKQFFYSQKLRLLVFFASTLVLGSFLPPGVAQIIGFGLLLFFILLFNLANNKVDVGQTSLIFVNAEKHRDMRGYIGWIFSRHYEEGIYDLEVAFKDRS